VVSDSPVDTRNQISYLWAESEAPNNLVAITKIRTAVTLPVIVRKCGGVKPSNYLIHEMVHQEQVVGDFPTKSPFKKLRATYNPPPPLPVQQVRKANKCHITPARSRWMSIMSDDKQVRGEGGEQERQEVLASMGDVDEGSTTSLPMVRWRGHLVTEKEAKILKHVFDDMQDHFGNRKCENPSVKFNFDPSLFLCKNEPYTYRSHPDPTPQDRWHGELDFTYTINNETYDMDYIAIDVSVLC
jgi:hypothetical protein